MELKSLKDFISIIGINSSNRTFMELKFRSLTLLLFLLFRSNRTFMELKYRHTTQHKISIVLF